MKNIISVIIISIAFGYTNSFSQEVSTKILFETQHLFTLSSGMSLHTVRDEMMSPLIYRGTQIPIEFSYRFRGLSNRHTFLFYYDNSELNSSITNKTKASHYIKNLNLNFEYSFATQVKAFEDFNTTCFLGSRLTSILNLRTHYFMQDKSHTSAEQMTGLGIYLLTETSFQDESNNFLRVEINIPCISYALLSNRYNANVSEKFDDLNFEQSILWQLFKKGNFISFTKLFEIQADISYNIYVSNYIGFGIQYRFQYYSFEQYESLSSSKVLNNQFLIGMTAKL
ncbi:MAG: hypothetical protein NTX22_12900 [Ignavibacteriales bacterium]|nr:hypothetical protein [Ignavibacteriales bacterium]